MHDLFPTAIFGTTIFRTRFSTTVILKVLFTTAIFRTATLNPIFCNGYYFKRLVLKRLVFPTASIQTASFLTSIYMRMPGHWRPHQTILPSLAEMSSLFRLDSSSSSSDDDDELILSALHVAQMQYEGTSAPRWGGSVVGRQYIYRDRMSGAWRLFNDYFSDNPVYGTTFFRRRFVITASNLILI